MQLDLRKDAARIRQYLRERARDYPVYVNAGPGKDNAKIQLMTLGFQFDQSGWVALVFDTRPQAEFDGEWQGYIEENALALAHWFGAFDAMSKKGGKLSVDPLRGKPQTFTAKSDPEDLAECLGSMCRAVLEDAREKGQFDGLPLADGCRLAVEEQGGLFGWVEGAEEYDEDAIQETLQKAARAVPKAQRVAFWVDQLDKLAAGEDCPAAKLVDGSGFVLEELSELVGNRLEPLMKFLLRWAGRPAFKLVRGETRETPSHDVVFSVLQALTDDWDWEYPPAEAMVQEFVRRAVKAKPVKKPGAKRELYGTEAYHGARLLHERFEYPEPKRSDTTNQLLNPDAFTGQKKTAAAAR